MATIEHPRAVPAAAIGKADLDPDPFRQFGLWLDAAAESGLAEPNAMTLATATPDGRPSARAVLLRAFDAEGFVFFTHYAGRKGRELAANPFAALVWLWPGLARQVRVEGRVARVPSHVSDTYFAGRPRAHQLGAWASTQSEVIPDRATLEGRMDALAERFAGREVPRPPEWGGFRLAPAVFEFWQGRPARLHDRLRYRRDAAGAWVIERLAP